jgi:hypothetical protein
VTCSLAVVAVHAPQRQPLQRSSPWVASRYEHPVADVRCMDVGWKNTILCIKLPSLDHYSRKTQIMLSEHIIKILYVAMTDYLIGHMRIWNLMLFLIDGLDVTKLVSTHFGRYQTLRGLYLSHPTKGVINLNRNVEW